MKRIIKDVDISGLQALLGENVLLMCANYFYTGKLTGVNDSFVELTDPSIVYETGSWSDRKYTNAEKMHTSKWYVQTAAIEAFGLGK